jgi:hypothetical protein
MRPFDGKNPQLSSFLTICVTQPTPHYYIIGMKCKKTGAYSNRNQLKTIDNRPNQAPNVKENAAFIAFCTITLPRASTKDFLTLKV